MNPPRKHHYVPVFYLKQWAGGDGRLCQYRKVYDGKVAANRKHPDATGYKVDLYKIDELSPEDAQAIELQFMKLLDDDAYRALEHIKNNPGQPFPGNLRSAWTRFLLSFIFRNPEAVATIKHHILALWREGIEALEADYAKLKKSGQPETLKGSIHPAQPHIGFANFLRDLIDNQTLGPTIHEMNWGVVHLNRSQHTLLTSDRPINMPFGLGDKNAYIAIAVGPQKLFVASHQQGIVARLAAGNHTSITTQMNRCVVTQAREYVWGLSDTHHTFVERNICSVADRQLLTDEQRQEAIAAAKGESTDLLKGMQGA